MAEFAQYYVEYLKKLFQNIGTFFSDRWAAIRNIFTLDIPGYISDLSKAAASFGVLGWICYILVTLVNFACIFFIVYRLCQIIRRFVFFRAREVEKDQLLEELAKEKEKVVRLTVEKNQLYALKINAMLPVMEEQTVAAEAETAVQEATRFRKLTEIDYRYQNNVTYISNAEVEGITLRQITDMFVNYAASQLHLYYKKDVARRFFAGMATTKVLILEGISGTGKTSLPYALGKFFSGDAALVSVQPSWRERSDLVGYLNEFTKTYNETEFLGALYEATYRQDPSFIVLDEMNLARIEYYFAEFLSVMEMPDPSEWTIDLVATAEPTDPKHLTDGKLLVPQGLWFVGTANQDDSTFTITDKVYDRTVTIDLNEKGEYFDAPLTEAVSIPYTYMDVLFQQAQNKFEISAKAMKDLAAVDDFIFNKFKVTFGNRIMRQIKAFVPVYVACGGTQEAAIDFLLMSKILRKFNALNLAFLKKELTELSALLDKLFGKGSCPLCTEYLKKLSRT